MKIFYTAMVIILDRIQKRLWADFVKVDLLKKGLMHGEKI